MDNSLLRLCFVRLVGLDVDENYTYELFFTSEDKLPNVWGDDFGEVPASICSELRPFTDTYTNVMVVKTDIKLVTAAESTQFSMQDAFDGCTCLAYEDLSEKEYPDYRIVFKFGETYDEVMRVFELKEIEPGELSEHES